MAQAATIGQTFGSLLTLVNTTIVSGTATITHSLGAAEAVARTVERTAINVDHINEDYCSESRRIRKIEIDKRVALLQAESDKTNGESNDTEVSTTSS